MGYFCCRHKTKEELPVILNHDAAQVGEISVETLSLQSLLNLIWEQQNTISQQQKTITDQQRTIELQRESISRFLADAKSSTASQPGISGREEVIGSCQDLDGGNILKQWIPLIIIIPYSIPHYIS